CRFCAQASRKQEHRNPARSGFEGRDRERGARRREADPPHGDVETRTAVATVPAGPHPILTALPPPQDKGRIVVDQNTEVPDWPGVWAIGDCPAIRQIDGNISPPTAQHALRQAKTCAENIVAAYRNNSKEEIRLHRARKTQITWQALSGRGNPGMPPQGD